jgi:hypothetical protein
LGVICRPNEINGLARRLKSLFALFRFGVTACAGHAASNFELRV